MASFDEQLSSVAPFLFYVVIAGVIFVETGLLIGFFLPGDSLLFNARLVAVTRDDINIAFLVFSYIFSCLYESLHVEDLTQSRNQILSPKLNQKFLLLPTGSKILTCELYLPDVSFKNYKCMLSRIQSLVLYQRILVRSKVGP